MAACAVVFPWARVVAGTRVRCSLACRVLVAVEPRSPDPVISLSLDCPGALVNRTVGASAQSACPKLASVRLERNGLPFTGLLRAGPGWVCKPGHPHAIVSSATLTKPDANLDCVLAAARVCACACVVCVVCVCAALSPPRRSPPPVSRYSPEAAPWTHPSLASRAAAASSRLHRLSH